MANQHSITYERISLSKSPEKSFSTPTRDYTQNPGHRVNGCKRLLSPVDTAGKEPGFYFEEQSRSTVCRLVIAIKGKEGCVEQVIMRRIIAQRALSAVNVVTGSA